MAEPVDIAGCSLFDMEDECDLGPCVIDNPFGVSITLVEGGEDLEGGQGEIIWRGGSSLISRTIKGIFPSIEGKSIIELGTGTGVLGLLLAMAGANVLLTDQEHVINGPILAQNVEANREDIETNGGSVKMRTLNWEKSLDFSQGEESFDLLVATDCYFFEYLGVKLVETILKVKEVNRNPALRIFLANDGRWNAKVRMLCLVASLFVACNNPHPPNQLASLASFLRTCHATLSGRLLT
jgi:predicted nicotinamide N-methyase